MRTIRAEKLTKQWIMGIRRGWLSLLKPTIQDYDDVIQAIKRLEVFVDNLWSEIRFVRQTSTAGFRERVRSELDRLEKHLSEERSEAHGWKEWIDGTAIGLKWGEDRRPDAEYMLERYRTNFAEVIGGHVPTRMKYKKTKHVDVTGFIDRVLKLLYEEAKWVQKEGPRTPSAATEFDLYGMKVVVEDESLGPYEINDYVMYLKEAYARLKAKGLQTVWYGTVYISCHSCGGVNYNTGGGVGGHFEIRKDVVRIFSRPGSFIVELMAHELGHRHWFKGMTQGQRARFESMVKVYHKVFPKQDIDFAEAERAISRISDKVQAPLEAIGALIYKPEEELRQRLPLALEALKKEALEFGTDVYKVMDTITPTSMYYESREVAQARDAFTGEPTSSEVRFRRHVVRAEVGASLWGAERPNTIQGPDFPKAVQEWWAKAYDLLNESVTDALKYVRAVKDALGSGEYEEGDERPVTPVSDYGKSNIDEAFAEVFAHYVLGKDLKRDQLESFKSVLKKAKKVQDLVLRVAAKGQDSFMEGRYT